MLTVTKNNKISKQIKRTKLQKWTQTYFILIEKHVWITRSTLIKKHFKFYIYILIALLMYYFYR